MDDLKSLFKPPEWDTWNWAGRLVYVAAFISFAVFMHAGWRYFMGY